MIQYGIRIPQQDIDLLLQHAEKHHPSESVALLFGRIHNSIVKVESIRLVENVADSHHTNFYVNPEDQYRIMMEEEDKGRALVCIFHSHPAPPRPSSSDLRNMKLNPIVWLIASKVTGLWKTGAFILADDEVASVRILNEGS